MCSRTQMGQSVTHIYTNPRIKFLQLKDDKYDTEGQRNVQIVGSKAKGGSYLGKASLYEKEMIKSISSKFSDIVIMGIRYKQA